MLKLGTALSLPCLRLALLLCAAAPARAATLGYELRLYGTDHNLPSVQLTNTSSTAGAEIVGFELTVGDERFHFDSVFRETHSAGVGATLLAPDRIGAGQDEPGTPGLPANARTDSIRFTTAGLTPGRFLRFKT